MFEMLDERGQAYYDGIMKAASESERPHLTGQMADLEVAALNFQRSLDDPKRPTSTAAYRTHKELINYVVEIMPGAITGDIYDGYCNHARCQDLEPRTYRRFTQLLKELEEEGEITSQRLNRGRFGRTRSWVCS